MLIPLRNCHNLEVDRVRVLCIHIYTLATLYSVAVIPIQSRLWGGNQIQLFDFPHNQHDNNFRNYEEIPIGDDKLNTVTTFNYSLGAVLTKISRGEEKIFAFVSRTLSDTERITL